MYKNEKGFSLIEVLVSIAMLALVSKGALSLLDFVTKYKMESSIKSTLALVNRNEIKKVGKSIQGLDVADFKEDLLYATSGSTYSNSNPSSPARAASDIDKDIPVDKFTSFSYLINSKKELIDDQAKYVVVSYCTTFDDYNLEPSISDLRDNELFPILKPHAGFIGVFCCKKSNPTCASNNILDVKTTDYLVRTAIFAYDKDDNALAATYLPRKGETRHVNSQGFFIYKDSNGELIGKTYSFWSDCTAKKLKGAVDLTGCGERVFHDLKRVNLPFNQSIGSGVNDLGDLGI